MLYMIDIDAIYDRYDVSTWDVVPTSVEDKHARCALELRLLLHRRVEVLLRPPVNKTEGTSCDIVCGKGASGVAEASGDPSGIPDGK